MKSLHEQAGLKSSCLGRQNSWVPIEKKNETEIQIKKGSASPSIVFNFL